MSVQVFTEQSDDWVFDNGKSWAAHDWHLDVFDVTGKMIATYAKGMWVSVRLVP